MIKRIICVVLCCTILTVSASAELTSSDFIDVTQAAQHLGLPDTVIAFLGSCGLGLYLDDGIQGGLENYKNLIMSLWDKYAESNPNIPLLKGARVIGNGLSYLRDTFNGLRGFTQWIINNYDITNNTQNIVINLNEGGGTGDYLPYYNSNSFLSGSVMRENGLRFVDDGRIFYICQIGSSDGKCLCGAITYGDKYSYYVKSTVNTSGLIVNIQEYTTTNALVENRLLRLTASYDGGYYNGPLISEGYYVTSTVFPTYANVTDFLGASGSGENELLYFDTSDLSIPEEIPATEQVGGVYMPGVGVVSTAADVSTVIDGLIEDRSIDVGIGDFVPISLPDVVLDVDGDVLPEFLEMALSDLTLSPDTLQVPYLYELFPFSLPWDMYNVLQALNTPAVTPVITFGLPIVGEEEPVEFTIDLTPWDGVAAICRKCEYIIFLVGALYVIWRKFG